MPLGGVLASDAHTLMQAPPQAIELFHGYTYSGHPLALCGRAGHLRSTPERLFERAIELGEYWQERPHALQGLPNVIDIRNFGLAGRSSWRHAGTCPAAVATRCSGAFHDAGCWCAVPVTSSRCRPR